MSRHLAVSVNACEPPDLLYIFYLPLVFSVVFFDDPLWRLLHVWNTRIVWSYILSYTLS